EGRDRADVLHGEAVPGVDEKTEGMGVLGRVAEGGELAVAGGAGRGLAVPSGVQLDASRTRAVRQLDGSGIWIDEEADDDAPGAQPFGRGGHAVEAGAQIEPALGRHFLAALRHERRLLRRD